MAAWQNSRHISAQLVKVVSLTVVQTELKMICGLVQILAGGRITSHRNISPHTGLVCVHECRALCVAVHTCGKADKFLGLLPLQASGTARTWESQYKFMVGLFLFLWTSARIKDGV